MLNVNDIDKEINMLECGQITYPILEKLSVLYTISDHFHRVEPVEEPMPAYAFLSAPESEFLQIVNGAPLEKVLQILDEHMNCVKILYPKEYKVLIQKISEL